MPNMIQIVDPTIDRRKSGGGIRDLTMRDIITVPVTYQRGTWGIGDMLNLRSVEALWVVHNAVSKERRKRTAAVQAPHHTA